jgi:hypothetical protein
MLLNYLWLFLAVDATVKSRQRRLVETTRKAKIPHFWIKPVTREFVGFSFY